MESAMKHLKRLRYRELCLLGWLLSSWAVAQPYGEQLADERPHEHFEFATVLSATPIKEIIRQQQPEQQCWQQPVAVQRERREHHSATNAIVGGIIGAAIGNQLGHHKRNKQVGAVAGALLGASIGNDLGRPAHAGYTTHYRQELQCNTVYRQVEEERIVGYRVRYRYQGQTFTTQTAEHPGDTLRLRVSMEPVL